MSHEPLELLLQSRDIEQLHHGLHVNDVTRADRMNWESAQRVMFPKVRECLAKINSGEAQPKENVVITMEYLNTC